jgi:hypothetical protein
MTEPHPGEAGNDDEDRDGLGDPAASHGNDLDGTVALSRNVLAKPSKVEALLHGRTPRKGRTTRPCP